MTERSSPPALPVSSASSASLLSATFAPPAQPAPPAQHHGLGTLRGVLTLLVLAHHALLAYHPFAPPAGPSLTAMPFWRAFPVVDEQRWSGATWVVGWNDTFFMALLFLLSGLFAWPSLQRKGAAAYARDRLLRLGLPFAACALALAPLAYVPSYLQTGAAWSWSGFWQQWRALGDWPTGPAWFLSLLLVFDAAALALFAAHRAVTAPRAAAAPHVPGLLGRGLALWRRSPLALFLALAGLAALAYVPMALHHGPLRWSTFGPLTFQTSRLFLYAAFFLAGLALGAGGLPRTALVPGGALARRFWLWTALAALAFWASTAATLRAIASMGLSAADNRLAALAYAAACAAISFAMLALALRLAARHATSSAASSGAPDTPAAGDAAPLAAKLAASLRHNAYGLYLFHYPIVSWLQYALLDARWPGAAKAFAVFSTTVATAWLLTIALRRLRPLARVL